MSPNAGHLPFKEENVKMLQWPSIPRDFKPIDHLWGEKSREKLINTPL